MLKYLLLIAVGLAMAQGLTHLEKRSLSSTLSRFGHSIHDVAVRLGRHLHDGITVSACTAICDASAVAILEAAAVVAAAVCPPCVTTFWPMLRPTSRGKHRTLQVLRKMFV